jgi:hypothetical protein
MSFHVIGSMEKKFSLLYYYDICCYQFGSWQNWASRETKPDEASYGPLVMDSVLQWLLCLILPLTILISQALSELVLSLGSKREIEKFSNSNVPSFAICLCKHKVERRRGWKQ